MHTLTMSYVTSAAPLNVQLYSCIRSVLCNNESQLVSIYNIMTVVNRCLGSHQIRTDDVLSLIDGMSDVHREPTTGFYYCSTEEACNKFKSRLQGNIESCTREKIKRIIHNAPKLIIEASQRGQLKLELEELTEAEYENSTIAVAVNNVLQQLYRVNVFINIVTDTQKREAISYAPFKSAQACNSERYWLCADLSSVEQAEKQKKKTVRFAEPLCAANEEEEEEAELTSEPQQ